MVLPLTLALSLALSLTPPIQKTIEKKKVIGSTPDSRLAPG